MSLFFYLVQHECIPQAILGMDVLCQAKSGMGKTAVFVLATLQQLEPVTGQVQLRGALRRAFRLGMFGQGVWFFLRSSPENMFVDFSEGGREREKGNTSVREALSASRMCLTGG